MISKLKYISLVWICNAIILYFHSISKWTIYFHDISSLILHLECYFANKFGGSFKVMKVNLFMKPSPAVLKYLNTLPWLYLHTLAIFTQHRTGCMCLSALKQRQFPPFASYSLKSFFRFVRTKGSMKQTILHLLCVLLLWWKEWFRHWNLNQKNVEMN